jgi:hypothetical protein
MVVLTIVAGSCDQDRAGFDHRDETPADNARHEI